MKDDVFICVNDKLKKCSLNTNQIDQYVSRFNLFLERDQGLAPSTRHRHCYFIHHFLQSCFGPKKKVQVNKISPQDITDFILSFSQKKSPEVVRHMVSSLRSFLRFLRMKNEIDGSHTDFIPPIACQRPDRLPDHLSKQELNKLLKTCDKKTAIGLRVRNTPNAFTARRPLFGGN